MIADLRARLRGAMVPLVTPFTPSLAIDWPAFDAHVARMLAAGAGVLIPGDLVGEAWALNVDERLALLERTVRLAAGRAVVLAKVSETSLPGAAHFADAAREAGADAVKLVLTAGSPEHVDTIGPGSGLPFLLETNGGEAALEAIDRFASQAGLVGIEETSLDLDRFDALVERYGGRLAVIAGSEDALGFTLLLGAAGFMTATPNFAPAFMTSLWEAGARSDARTTLALYRRLKRYRGLFFAELRAGRPMFASYTKAALALLGHPVGPPRPPLVPLTDVERAALRATLREALGLTPA